MPDSTPEGAVRDLMEHLDRAESDNAEMKLAYELLSSSVKENLRLRAERASSALGKSARPEDMLAPARFSLRFLPRQFHSKVAGQTAVVEVAGIDPQSDRANVPCVLENGHWRVALALPPVPLLEKRQGPP